MIWKNKLDQETEDLGLGLGSVVNLPVIVNEPLFSFPDLGKKVVLD